MMKIPSGSIRGLAVTAAIAAIAGLLFASAGMASAACPDPGGFPNPFGGFAPPTH